MLVDGGGRTGAVSFPGDNIQPMKLTPQQKHEIYCAILRGITSTAMSLGKPSKVAVAAAKIAKEAIAAAESGEHF